MDISSVSAPFGPVPPPSTPAGHAMESRSNSVASAARRFFNSLNDFCEAHIGKMMFFSGSISLFGTLVGVSALNTPLAVISLIGAVASVACYLLYRHEQRAAIGLEEATLFLQASQRLKEDLRCIEESTEKTIQSQTARFLEQVDAFKAAWESTKSYKYFFKLSLITHIQKLHKRIEAIAEETAEKTALKQSLLSLVKTTYTYSIKPIEEQVRTLINAKCHA